MAYVDRTDMINGLLNPILDTEPPAAVAYTDTAAATAAALPEGDYWVLCTTAAYLRSGTSAPTADSGDTYVAANERIPFHSDGTLFLGAVRETANGTMHIMRLN